MMIYNNITLYIMHLLGLEVNSFPSLALAHKSITSCEDKKWVLISFEANIKNLLTWVCQGQYFPYREIYPYVYWGPESILYFCTYRDLLEL